VTWNANSLCTKSPNYRVKFDTLLSISKTADIICLQETHGGIDQFLTHFPTLPHSFIITASPGPADNIGGVAILVRQTLFPSDTPPILQISIPGRLIRLFFQSQPHELIIWSTHNLNIMAEDLRL
jgi:exonuclease III